MPTTNQKLTLSNFTLLTLTLTVLFLNQNTLADRVNYYNRIFEGVPSPYTLKFEPMYNLIDTPSGFDTPRIDYDLLITSNEAPTDNGIAYLVIALRDDIVSNNELLSAYSECQSGDQLKIPHAHKIPIRFNDAKQPLDINSISKGATTRLKGSFEILYSGLFTTFFVVCEGKISVTGSIFFRNSYGLLPGHKYGLKQFYIWMTTIYVILFAVWIGLCKAYKKELFFYHYCIALILFFTLLEMGFDCIETFYFNSTGLRNHLIYISAHQCSVMRRTVSRILIIALCSGVGIAKPSLERRTIISLFILSTFYFLISTVFEVHKLNHYKAIQSLDGVYLGLELTILLIDSIYYIWMFSALSITLEDLKSQEHYKLVFYSRFCIVLIGAVFATTLFNIYDGHYRKNVAQNTKTGQSSYWFVEEGYQTLQTTVILSFIMYLWRPSANSSRYAFHEQLPTSEAEYSEEEQLDDVAQSHSLLMNRRRRLVDSPDNSNEALVNNALIDALSESQPTEAAVDVDVETQQVRNGSLSNAIMDEIRRSTTAETASRIEKAREYLGSALDEMTANNTEAENKDLKSIQVEDKFSSFEFDEEEDEENDLLIQNLERNLSSYSNGNIEKIEKIDEEPKSLTHHLSSRTRSKFEDFRRKELDRRG